MLKKVSFHSEFETGTFLIVGWQATQKLNFNNTIRQMKFDGGICLFGCLSLGLSMLYIGIGPQHQIPEGLGPILRIYDERFHLPNRVIKFPNRPLFGNWPTDYQ